MEANLEKLVDAKVVKKMEELFLVLIRGSRVDEFDDKGKGSELDVQIRACQKSDQHEVGLLRILSSMAAYGLVDGTKAVLRAPYEVCDDFDRSSRGREIGRGDERDDILEERFIELLPPDMMVHQRF